ncbi:MAG: hypothetical protein GEU74_15555 [Nitriliruptorales bacterium]|nr:hypothetical protein [Nitriliruptorales bacterium]
MSLIRFAPPLNRAVAAQAQVIGEVFPSVALAAAAGAEWAWTTLHRCVAPPATGYLQAAGASDPHAAFERVFVEVARDFRASAGDEAAFRIRVFELAHHHVMRGLPRRRHPRTTDLAVLSRLSDGPPVPAAVERAHVAAAVAAVNAARAKAARRPRRTRSRRRGAGTAGMSLTAVLLFVAGPVGKVAAGATLAVAATTGVLALDPLPQRAAAPVQPGAEAAEAHDARGDGGRGKATVARGERRRAVQAGTGGDIGQPRDAGRKPAGAGLETAAAAPDTAGEHRDGGHEGAGAAPHGRSDATTVDQRLTVPADLDVHGVGAEAPPGRAQALDRQKTPQVPALAALPPAPARPVTQ